MEEADRERGGKSVKCGSPKNQRKLYFTEQRVSNIDEMRKRDWKMGIVYRNMEEIVDLTEGCWRRLSSLVFVCLQWKILHV